MISQRNYEKNRPRCIVLNCSAQCMEVVIKLILHQQYCLQNKANCAFKQPSRVRPLFLSFLICYLPHISRVFLSTSQRNEQKPAPGNSCDCSIFWHRTILIGFNSVFSIIKSIISLQWSDSIWRLMQTIVNAISIIDRVINAFGRVQLQSCYRKHLCLKFLFENCEPFEHSILY